MATIKDIAKIANVNISTVSRALRGLSGVSEEMRIYIHEIAEKVGYNPDFSARALVGKSTKLIGVIVPEISSNYYSQIVDNFENKLNAIGYSTIIETTGFMSKKEIACIKTMIGRKVDGIIFAGMFGQETYEFIRNKENLSKMPFVLFETENFTSHNAENINVCFDTIETNVQYGMSLAIEHLIGLGHKIIGLIGERRTQMRISSFKKAMEEYGMPLNKKLVMIGNERFEYGGYLRMNELLKRKTIPTAVCVMYDYMAIGAMKALQEAGLKVPDDVSIIGYDNIRESEYLFTPLTTINPPVTEISIIAVEILQKCIKNKNLCGAAKMRLNPELIIRKSTAVIKNDTAI